MRARIDRALGSRRAEPYVNGFLALAFVAAAGARFLRWTWCDK